MNRYSNLSPLARRVMDAAWAAMTEPTDERLIGHCELAIAALRQIQTAARGGMRDADLEVASWTAPGRLGVGWE